MSTEQSAENPAEQKPADSDLDQFLSSRQADPEAVQEIHAAPSHSGRELMEDMRQRQKKKFWLAVLGVFIVLLLVTGGILMMFVTADPTPSAP